MTIHEFNILPKDKVREELYKCCGSIKWVEKMMPFVPAEDLVELLEDAEEQWGKCSQEDWKEAFAQHPKIGDINSLKKKFAETADWASQEQKGISVANEVTIQALAKGNSEYEKKFGYIFIVSASGKTAEEMLSLLNERLRNEPGAEILIAADEQNKITKLRIQKMFA